MLVTAVVCGMIMFAAVSPSAATTPIWGYSYQELAAEWWKWVYSIPCTEDWCPNPVVDTTGDYCAVGQHGDVWFLAGAFGGEVERHCYVPEGMPLFFPVINSGVAFDSPNACGQGPESYSVKELRSWVAPSIDAATKLSATLDGKPVRMQREQSVVFEIAVPKNNVYEYLFNIECAQGVYSPAVDDGYYALLNPLKKGPHTLHIHAEIPQPDPYPNWVLDVTYNLTVVPVKLK